MDHFQKEMKVSLKFCLGRSNGLYMTIMPLDGCAYFMPKKIGYMGLHLSVSPWQKHLHQDLAFKIVCETLMIQAMCVCLFPWHFKGIMLQSCNVLKSHTQNLNTSYNNLAFDFMIVFVMKQILFLQLMFERSCNKHARASFVP